MSLDQILAGMSNLHVLVIGDICLDRWCTYEPALSEESRETGIPRVAVVRTQITPGAGGTVANNLAALGVGEVAVLGLVGSDGFSWELKAALTARGIAPDLLITEKSISTFTYTKLINSVTGEEDLPRVDYVNAQDLPEEAEDRVLEQFEAHAHHFDVVIVSDQAETQRGGVVSPRVRERVVRLAKESNKIIWVDSRMRPELFTSVTLKPNRSEAEAACQRLFGAADLQRMCRDLKLRHLFVTEGSAGARVLTTDGEEEFVAGRKVKAVDICGAGDSFSAGAACALAITGSARDAAEFGNLVASITVTKRGTGTASPDELRAAQ